MKFLDKVPLISYGAYSGREKAAELVLKPNISAKEKDVLETEYQAVKKIRIIESLRGNISFRLCCEFNLDAKDGEDKREKTW